MIDQQERQAIQDALQHDREEMLGCFTEARAEIAEKFEKARRWLREHPKGGQEVLTALKTAVDRILGEFAESER
jgi:hypothetical protein